VELQTIYPTVPTGTAVTLTAVSSVDVGPTPYYIEIFDNNTGTLIARCGRGTTCTVSVRFDTPAAHRYIAYIAGYSATYPPAGIQSASVDAEPWVTWTSSDLRVGVSTSWGDPSQPYSVTATTNADVGPTPYYIEIFSEFRDPVTGLDNGFSLLAACSSGTTCPSGDVPAGTRVTAFVAPLVRSLPPGTVANSRTVLHGLIP